MLTYRSLLEERGVFIDWPVEQSFNPRGKSPQDVEDVFKRLYNQILAKGQQPQLIMILMGARESTLYGLIKHLADVKLKVHFFKTVYVVCFTCYKSCVEIFPSHRCLHSLS